MVKRRRSYLLGSRTRMMPSCFDSGAMSAPSNAVVSIGVMAVIPAPKAISRIGIGGVIAPSCLRTPSAISVGFPRSASSIRSIFTAGVLLPFLCGFDDRLDDLAVVRVESLELPEHHLQFFFGFVARRFAGQRRDGYA